MIKKQKRFEEEMSATIDSGEITPEMLMGRPSTTSVCSLKNMGSYLGDSARLGDSGRNNSFLQVEVFDDSIVKRI